MIAKHPEVDALIRKYGYQSTEQVLSLYRQPENEDMRDIAHGTAHLLHGTSEGRFTIRYATKSLSKEEIESVHYQYANLDEALARYNPR